MSLPDVDRRCFRCPGDATTACFAWINWASREFFYGSHDEFARPFLPPVRMDSNTSEIAFPVALDFAMICWAGGDYANWVMSGATGNSRGDICFINGHAERGDGLRLPRDPRHWAIRRNFRYFSYYCRS